jgi:hypothetical protein
MLTDIDYFLNFSERNIELQYISEQQSIERRANDDEFAIKDENLARAYRESLVAHTQRRFTIMLPTQIRYASLSAMTSAIDWTARFYQKSWKPKPPKNLRNPEITALRLLEYFDTTLMLNKAEVLKDYQNLLEIRNAVVHSSGLVHNYHRPKVLKKAVEQLKGFSIVNRDPIGECVQIDQYALPPYIHSMSWLLHEIYVTGTTHGYLQYHSTGKM